MCVSSHGGGYQYRLCPLKSKLTEDCFHQTPVPFAGDSSLMLANGTKIPIKSTFLSTGTLPVGSTWQTLPIPATYNEFPPPNGTKNGFQFPPPCYEPTLPTGLNTGRCSGEVSGPRYRIVLVTSLFPFIPVDLLMRLSFDDSGPRT